jgi:RNA polymerase sigma-70 factor (ECF subfamily)
MVGMRDGLAGLLPSLRRLARALTRDRDAADDLVQETLARDLTHESLWRGGSLKAWVVTILLNQHRNRQRALSRRGRTDPLDEARIAGGLPASTDVELKAIERGLALLPDEQREVLLLVALEGLTYKEAADALGIPIGTVMSRLSRARASLRTYLEGDSVVPLRRPK